MAGQTKEINRKQYYVAVRLVFFVFLPLKGKQEKSKLSVLWCLSGEQQYSDKDSFRATIQGTFLRVLVDWCPNKKYQ